MKNRFIEHTLSIVIVILSFGVLISAVTGDETARRTEHLKSLEPYLLIDSMDFGDPLHRALFKETLDVFHPDRRAANDSLVRALDDFRQEQFTRQVYKTGATERGLSKAKLLQLAGMYARFIAIYLLVMVLSYHAARSLAVFRFVKMKQRGMSNLDDIFGHKDSSLPRVVSLTLNAILPLLKAIAKGLIYAVLFAPAYVIAYSIRSGFDTDSYLFMVVLGVVSNGMLITYASKFYTFLVSESRKGYVQTAIVKGLDASYAWGTKDGVSLQAVLRSRHLFPSHVFRHVYLNARFQYLPSLKEQASFLITGLIIIEMALNVQGHLGYELLQSILYKQYDVVAAIIAGIFLIVKATEIIVDLWCHRESQKYENT